MNSAAAGPGRGVLIIGAGVIGLTTAVTLAEAGHHVRVLTAELPQATTSAVAGALWGPWLVEPRSRVLRWAQHSLGVLRDLAAQPGTGVRIARGFQASNLRRELPDWAGLLTDRRPCTAAELPAGYAYGICYAAPLVDMPVHLTYLTARLCQAGGTIEQHHLTGLEEATRLSAIVVNCAGTGARQLAGDISLYPVRGECVVVTNPGLTDFVEIDTGDSTDLTAIYPHPTHVVLGGTAQAHRWDRRPDQATAHAIRTRCATLEPRLHDVAVLDQRVGLRPTRSTIRLERDTTITSAQVIHNYGHGGAGVSLA